MATIAAQPRQAQPQSTWALAWRRFKKHRLAMASLVFIILLILMAVLAPYIAPYDPTAQPTGENLGAQYFNPPSPQHWLGTDDLGRDVLSRIIYGARISLLVGFTAAIASVLIGTVLGTLAGYFSGKPFRFYLGPLAQAKEGWQPALFAGWRVISWGLYYLALYLVADLAWRLSGDDVRAYLGGERSLGNLLSGLGLLVAWGAVAVAAIWGIWGTIRLDLDIVISRVIDFVLTIPTLPLLLVLSALLRDPNVVVGQWAQAAFGESASVFIIIAILVVLGWTGTARLIRGAILSLREQDFTAAAQAMGAGEGRIMFRHLVPNALAPVIVSVTLGVGDAIVTEAALSFLGFGIQPPVATWGNMLSNAQEYIFSAPWLALAPGFMIFVTVLAFNYMGDGLRDALDPRSRL